MAYQQAADRYLKALEATLAPDMVRGVYIVGSAALGSWRPGRSDLDVLVVLDRPMTDSDLAMVGEMHTVLEATRAGGPHSDAHYITPDLLGARSEVRVPFSVDGSFKPEGHTTDPVLWAILDQYGVTLRGPRAAELKVGPDPVWLREWNHGNLESYWRNHVNRRARFAKQEPGSAVDPYLLAWEVTGPGRLHATIATGKVISKEASADYTARLFPKYADLCAKAKAYRMGEETVTCTTTEALRVIDLVEAVCNSAKELP